jgi:CheY-like chemotaxis protein
MPRLTVRCHNCGNKADLDLTEVDEHLLKLQGFLARYCNECRGNTHWERHQTATPARIATSSPIPQLHGRVLLIDDDPSILTVIGKALSRALLDVETAGSAREAITKLARADYDVVLSDIRMPEFDGKQLFAFLDEHMPEYKQKVVFLTGDTATPSTIEFLQEMKCPYLTKPIDMDSLLEIVGRFLPQEQ